MHAYKDMYAAYESPKRTVANPNQGSISVPLRVIYCTYGQNSVSELPSLNFSGDINRSWGFDLGD